MPPGFEDGPAAPAGMALAFPLCLTSVFGERPQTNSGSVQLQAPSIRESGVPWRHFLISQGQDIGSHTQALSVEHVASFCSVC